MEQGRAARSIQRTWISFGCRPAPRTRGGHAERRGKTLDADSELQLTGANLIEVLFQAQGDRSLLKQMRTEGRSVINLSAPKSKQTIRALQISVLRPTP